MSTQDKKIKVVNDIDLNNNEIENAKIDYNKNQITNLPEGGLVDDVLVNGESVVENKVARVTVPTVNNATVTINQGGELKGTFTLNQSSNAVIDLEEGGNNLVAGDNISIDTEGNYWTNFGGENDNNLKLLNSIPSFSSIRIIFKALYNSNSDDNALFCRQDVEKYFGIKYESCIPSIFEGHMWIDGQDQVDENIHYWFCLDSSDGQTFTYYTIEDNNYTLSTLPQLSEWTEQCNINEDFLSGEDFYIGYNPFSLGEYWKGKIFECQIIVDNQEWFNLQTAEEGVDYENNGCEYVGELTNPVISAKNTEYKSSFNIAITDNHVIDFKGYHYQVHDFINSNIDGHQLPPFDCIISENSLVFLNGQLLRRGTDYDYNSSMWYENGIIRQFRTYQDLENWDVQDLPEGCVVKILHDENHDDATTYYEWQIINDSGDWVYLEDGYNDEPRFKSYIYDLKEETSQDNNIKIINGLQSQNFTGITGTVIDLGHYVQSNMIVLRNGILLCGENSWNTSPDNENAIILGTPLRANETLTIISNYNMRLVFPDGIAEFESDRKTLKIKTNIPDESLVWKDTLLQTLNEDYIIDGNNIVFNEEIAEDDNDVFVQVCIPQPQSIYNAIADKQDKLPEFKAGGVLSNDGSQLKWIDVDDGVYHPKNDDELKKIINSDIWGGTIDFGAFDWNTVDPNGYIINDKSFSIKNISFSWGETQFRWLKTPLFTLNNSNFSCADLALNVDNIHYDPSNNEDANTAPVIRVNNGGIQITKGMININNVTGIKKYVGIELNNSTTQIESYGIFINGFDENKPEEVETEVCGIEVNGSSEVVVNSVSFRIFGATKNYAVKYNDDIPNFIKFGSVGIDIPDNDYTLWLPNTSTLNVDYTNLGKISSMEPNVLQFEADTEYHTNDIIEIDGKLVRVNEDFNSNDYISDVQQGYADDVYMDFWTVNVHGTMYSAYDPNNRITLYETDGGNYRVSGLTLDTDNWNFPISDPNLQSNNAQDAIKELAARGGGGSISQTDYWQHAEVIQDTITGITGDITVNESTYFSQVTGDRWVSYFKYDGSDWYLGDPDEGETPTLVNLNDYGIDVSQATFDTDSSFEVYSEYLNGKTSFTVSQLVDIHSVFLNGILQLKKDYEVNNHTITFNDYTLKSSDSISII